MRYVYEALGESLAYGLLLQSLKVKAGYIDQLRDLGLVTDHLLPTIFTLLGLYGGIPKAFKLDIWAIDEFYLHCEYDASIKVAMADLV